MTNALDNETGCESNMITYHNTITSYFDNLTKNFSVNYKGSCGYVAIGILLSYYDTFLDDNIIPLNCMILILLELATI